MSSIKYSDIISASSNGIVFPSSTASDLLIFTETNQQSIIIGTDIGNNPTLVISKSNLNFAGNFAPISNNNFDIGNPNSNIRNAYIGNNLYSSKVGIGILSNLSFALQLASDSAAKPATNTWSVTSDARLKSVIVLADLDICYDIVKRLPLKRFTWNTDAYSLEDVSDRTKIGWIAQDVENIFPKAVGRINFKDIPDCRTLNADQIYAVMYGAIQKLQKNNEIMSSNIAYLMNEMKQLTKQ
jgi:hypothetical protein